MTVLSQATSDLNSGRAFASLKERFPAWEEALAAPVGSIADAIRAGGIADVKARRIKSLLQEIKEREGKLDLSRLDRVTDEEATEYLLSFHGVGPKTVACVLVFSMGRDAFPIDTHVLRVAKRLGWISAKLSAEGAAQTLAPKVPPKIRYYLHLALIEHGRKVCKASRPLCSTCAVFDLCAAGPAFLADGLAE
ncbi:MAG: endonuclease [Actinomycetota bacterium]|jgi:endonuclease-3|nr:endonuclease [Actinomycetota bacterium]